MLRRLPRQPPLCSPLPAPSPPVSLLSMQTDFFWLYQQHPPGANTTVGADNAPADAPSAAVADAATGKKKARRGDGGGKVAAPQAVKSRAAAAAEGGEIDADALAVLAVAKYKRVLQNKRGDRGGMLKVGQLGATCSLERTAFIWAWARAGLHVESGVLCLAAILVFSLSLSLTHTLSLSPPPSPPILSLKRKLVFFFL